MVSVRDLIVDLIEWRKEQDLGLSTLPITEWMDSLLRLEFGKRVREIDGVKLQVIPSSGHFGIQRQAKETIDEQA